MNKIPIKLCHCETYNPECTRAGKPMTPRMWELCSGKNCTQEQSERHRAYWDHQSQTIPGWTERAANFIKAMAKYAASGFQQASDTEYQKRIDICTKCDQNDNGTCKQCGCIWNVKAKMASEECPLEKWPRIELTIVEEGKKCGGCGNKSA